jgi:thymidylate synthase (FAD)
VTPNALQLIERAGRVCYKSEDKITASSAIDFVKMLICRNHEAVLEHATMTMLFVTDRGITHELVRHRLASYCQESTRYCNYGNKEIEFVVDSLLLSDQVRKLLQDSEDTYKTLIKDGVPPQYARDVLPTCLKTEIVMTANMREWRHVFKLRHNRAAHPKMQRLMSLALWEVPDEISTLFANMG